MYYAFVVLLVISIVNGVSAFMMFLSGDNFTGSNIIIFLQLIISTLLAYCGIQLKNLCEKKQPSKDNLIPKSEAKKDFRYLYVDTKKIIDSELKDALEWVFTRQGYQIIDDINNLTLEKKEKLISINMKDKEKKGQHAVTFYGKNIDGITVFSITKKNKSFLKAREEVFEALKQ